MAKAIDHARSSFKKFGIPTQDTIDIHNMMDSSKAYFPDNRHRVIFHNAFGVFLIEKLFGINFDKLENLRKKYNLPESFIEDYQKQREIDRQSGTEMLSVLGKPFCIRTIAEEHIIEDFRKQIFPTLQDYLENMELKPWMNNGD